LADCSSDSCSISMQPHAGNDSSRRPPTTLFETLTTLSLKPLPSLVGCCRRQKRSRRRQWPTDDGRSTPFSNLLISFIHSFAKSNRYCNDSATIQRCAAQRTSISKRRETTRYLIRSTNFVLSLVHTLTRGHHETLAQDCSCVARATPLSLLQLLQQSLLLLLLLPPLPALALLQLHALTVQIASYLVHAAVFQQRPAPSRVRFTSPDKRTQSLGFSGRKQRECSGRERGEKEV
jgi:hypothetical protein